MKFNKILKVLTGLTFLSSYAFAEKQNDCKEIENYLKEKEYADKFIDKCVENDNGQVTTLIFKNILSSLTQEDIDKLVSYKTLNILEYNHRQEYEFTGYDEPLEKEYDENSNTIILPDYPDIDTLPDVNVPNFNLNELTELTELHLIDYGYYISGSRVPSLTAKYSNISSKNQFKLPNSLKKLYLEGITLNQLYIDTINSVTNLEEIHFYNCNLSEANLEELSVPKIIIEDHTYSYGHLEENILSKLINIKNLTLKHIQLNDNIIKEIGELTNLEELEFNGCIEYDYYSKTGNRGCLYEGNGCFEVTRFVLNWDYLKTLSKLKTLIINERMDIPSWVIRDYINNMKNLKKLEINGNTPSELSDCKDIDSYLVRKGQGLYEYKDEKSSVECVENDVGQVTSLIINNIYSSYTEDEEMINRLASYPTINSLSIESVSLDQENIDMIANLAKLKELVMNDVEISEENIQKLIQNLKYLMKLEINKTTYEVEPSATDEPTEPVETSECPKAEALGYQCCSHCHSIYSDKNGLWGAEHGKWCGIPDKCQSEYETCWSIKKGYPCCNHCKVHTEDKSGKWGIMDKKWCGIPTSC